MSKKDKCDNELANKRESILARLRLGKYKQKETAAAINLTGLLHE
jgi:hypothetical protein